MLYTSPDGSVHLELISDSCTCVLNGDALVPGHAFTLHHGDRLFIGTERLLLVSLCRPDHDGSHDHAAAANAAKGFGSYAIAPPQSPSKPPGTSGGALAFRLEAESLMRRAESELLDATGLRFHELHRLRRAGPNRRGPLGVGRRPRFCARPVDATPSYLATRLPRSITGTRWGECGWRRCVGSEQQQRQEEEERSARHRLPCCSVWTPGHMWRGCPRLRCSGRRGTGGPTGYLLLFAATCRWDDRCGDFGEAVGRRGAL